MNIEKLLIIPQAGNLNEYLQLSKEYSCGFEYNDFFLPKVLDDSEKINSIMDTYDSCEELPSYCTMHGAFLDVTIFSDDPRIVEVSDYRVEQSLQIACKLDAKGIVFHTNYLPNFLLESYRKNWVLRNETYWRQKLHKYKDINIYIENMFDVDCELLVSLAEKLRDEDNFGICFDYAHAHVFGNKGRDIEEWAKKLGPYIKHVHINDNCFEQDSHLALGEGSIDWKRFKALYEQCFSEASVLIEVSGIERARTSLEYLKLL